MILALLSSAFADCDLHDVKIVDFGLTKITIDARPYRFDDLTYELQACGYNDTAAELQRWSRLRLGADVTCLVGTLCLWPAVLATPVYAVMAYRQREDVTLALREESASP